MYDDERCEILTLSIRYEGLDPLDAWWEEFIGQVISFCLRYESCPYKVDVSLLFANDLLIKEIIRTIEVLMKLLMLYPFLPYLLTDLQISNFRSEFRIKL